MSKKGQIVIPKEIRDQMGLKEGDVLSFKVQSDKVVIEKLTNISKRTMSEILEKSKPIENSLEFQRKLREKWD